MVLVVLWSLLISMKLTADGFSATMFSDTVHSISPTTLAVNLLHSRLHVSLQQQQSSSFRRTKQAKLMMMTYNRYGVSGTSKPTHSLVHLLVSSRLVILKSWIWSQVSFKRDSSRITFSPRHRWAWNKIWKLDAIGAMSKGTFPLSEGTFLFRSTFAWRFDCSRKDRSLNVKLVFKDHTWFSNQIACTEFWGSYLIVRRSSFQFSDSHELLLQRLLNHRYLLPLTLHWLAYGKTKGNPIL